MRFYKFLHLIAFFSLFSNAQVFAAKQFDYLHHALRYWLNEPKLTLTNQVTVSSLVNYAYLPQIRVDKILSDPNSPWKVFKVESYDRWSAWAEVPLNYSEIQTDSQGTKKYLLVDGFYFVYRDTPQGQQHFVVRVYMEMEGFLTGGYRKVDLVKIYSSKESHDAAEQFAAEVRAAEVSENIYKHNILQYGGGQIGFLDNMDLIGKIEWDDLILDKDLKARSFRATQGFLEMVPALTKAGLTPKKGVLLAGPPGTGKSLMGQILISSILNGNLKDKVTFISVASRNLDYPHSVKVIFEAARKLAPAVVFIEDIDLLGAKGRENADEATKALTTLNEMLNSMDGAVSNPGVLAIGTTNKPEDVDFALRRSERFGVHLYFGLPSYFERQEFFTRFGKKKAEWEETITLEWLAASTDKFSGSDIVEAIRLAKQKAYLEHSMAANGNILIKKLHFEKAFELVRGAPVGPNTLGFKAKSGKKDLGKSIKLLRDLESKL